MAVLPDGRGRIGEVIETSSVVFWVECDRLNDLPPLGSLVCTSTTEGDSIYAVVAFGQTTGIDATRRAVRRGSDDVRDQEVYRRHPELTQILRTTFEAVPVAFKSAEKLRRIVPPIPPPLHYSVDRVGPRDLYDLTDDPRYLSLLAAYSGELSSEQLIVAHLRAVYAERGGDLDWLELAGREVARLFKRDYERLLPILEAVDPYGA